MPEILDEDALRELMLRCTVDLAAPPSATAAAIRRQRRRQVRTRVLSAAATAAAAGIAVGTIASASGPDAGAGTQAGGIRLSAAQQALFGLSTAAARTSRPDGRYVVLKEKTITTDGGGTDVETGPKTSVIDTVTGSGVTYQDISVRAADGTPKPPAVLNSPPGSSPTRARLDAMPTAMTELRAVLMAQAKEQLGQDYKIEAERMKETGRKYPVAIGLRPTIDDLVVEQATNLLWQPGLSPALRSAVYKLLAATPGVTVRVGTTDSSGRPATEIRRVDSTDNTDVETFEDPATGATLESAWRSSNGALAEDLYLSISYTNTVPPNPYQG